MQPPSITLPPPHALEGAEACFRRLGYFKLPQLFDAVTVASFKNEVERLSPLRMAHDRSLSEYRTQRKMTTLGGRALRIHSPLFSGLYENEQLKSLVSEVTGSPVFPCTHQDEFMVLNVFDDIGSTHGWHFDDPAYALIIVIAAPDAETGGLLEFVSPGRLLDEKADIQSAGSLPAFLERARGSGHFHTAYHQGGDAYILRSDRNIHRVTPLLRPERRAIINLAYQESPHVWYGNSASILYS